MGSWHVWRELRRRAWLRLEWRPLAGTGGQITDHPDGRVIHLDPRLGPRRREAVLAHELVHDERGLPGRGTPPWCVAREEAAVDRIADERLMPAADLVALIEQRAPLEAITALLVADEFDVDEDVAARQLERLKLAG
jgi:Zn-dependent peptidase ImmA (M78 family)